MSQTEVMAMIPQFSEAEICQARFLKLPDDSGRIGVLVFNMERGVHLPEIGDYLEMNPGLPSFDILLANELDDGCLRSEGKDTAKELADRLGMNYVYGLEFIELANENDPKGFHGNAVFSRWPIVCACVVRLPEAYNWYFDREKRIGGRLAVLTELDVRGKRIGVGSIHLESRTDEAGRRIQMEAVLNAADEMFGSLPVILGGDLNTNTFDGRSKSEVARVSESSALRRRCLEDVKRLEGTLVAAKNRGYALYPEKVMMTRRKPMPDGSFLPLRLDWILTRNMPAGTGSVLSTARADCDFAIPGSSLYNYEGDELSDHNAVYVAF